MLAKNSNREKKKGEPTDFFKYKYLDKTEKNTNLRICQFFFLTRNRSIASRNYRKK